MTTPADARAPLSAKSSGNLWVVPSERHRERLGRAGERAETRTALAHRLLAALAPHLELATPEVTRIAVGAALVRLAARDALLAPLARAGGRPWLRTVDAVDSAIAELRASGTSRAALAKVALAGGGAGRRAGTLLAASEAIDEELARAKLVDGRCASAILAREIARASPADVAATVGATYVVARWIAAWDAADLTWWRALDAALSRARADARRDAGAKIELPSFDRALDSLRERDPLEIVVDDVATALDDAPLTTTIHAPLGDLSGMRDVPKEAALRVEIRECADAQGQARAAVDAVHDALARGIAIDAIAIGVPRIDEESIGPIRALLDEARIVAHDPRGPAPVTSGVVSLALDALALAARGLPRTDVAALLRSRYIDARKVTGIDDRRAAANALHDVARALELTPTASASDPIGALEATARAWRARSDRAGDPEADATRAALARRVGELLSRIEDAGTHVEHVAAARGMWDDLGLGAAPTSGVREVLRRDEAPVGIARAELYAVARDAHAWEMLLAALDAHESAAVRLGVGSQPIDGDAFRHQLARALEANAPPPGAARVAAVRIAKLTELAAEPLALLVVIDANEGILPPTIAADPLLPEALALRLREADPRGAPPSITLRRARELAALALAASSAEHIVLAYRLRDAQGAAMTCAPIVAWLERARVPKTRWRASPISSRPLSAAEAVLCRLVETPEEASTTSPSAARRADIERRREGFFYDPARALDAVVGKIEVNDLLSSALSAETGGANRPLAVTALERLARCPFQGYAAAVLGGSERRRRGELPDAREEGTLVHEALAAAFRATREDWARRPRDAEVIVARALAAVDETLERERGASVLRRLVLDRVKDDVRAVLSWSLADEEWDFASAEQPFGEPSGESWPPLRIAASGVALLLRGKIDRVDTSHLRAAVRAIDYKRSKRAVDAGAKDLGELAFQVPLYALIAAEQLRRPALSGLYVPTGARDLDAAYRAKDAFVARWASIFEIEDGEPKVVRAALRVVSQTRDGLLAPVPRDKSACAQCGFRGGCRKPRFAIEPADDD